MSSLHLMRQKVRRTDRRTHRRDWLVSHWEASGPTTWFQRKAASWCELTLQQCCSILQQYNNILKNYCSILQQYYNFLENNIAVFCNKTTIFWKPTAVFCNNAAIFWKLKLQLLLNSTAILCNNTKYSEKLLQYSETVLNYSGKNIPLFCITTAIFR